MADRKKHYKLNKLCENCGKKQADVYCLPKVYRSYIKHPEKLPKYCSDCRKTLKHNYSQNNAPTGTRKTTSQGYIFIKCKDGTWQQEHKLVMEQMLKRPLKAGENIHHKDTDRANNKPYNLELWLTTHPSGIRASDLLCPHCGKAYFPTPELLNAKSSGGKITRGK